MYEMKYRDFEFVKRVILSCITFRQNRNAFRLIKIFSKKYDDRLLIRHLYDIEIEHSRKL